MGCASRWPAAISRRACSRKRSRPSRASPRRSTSTRRSRSRKPRAPAPRPMSSPRPKAPRCISTACASAPNDFDPAVRDRLIAGAMVPAPLVDRAQKFRRWYRAQLLELFETSMSILAPATPCVAPKIGQVNFVLDGVELPVRANIGIYTQPISFIGLPVVAVPVPLDRCRSACRSSRRPGARTSRCASPTRWSGWAWSPRRSRLSESRRGMG